ncbi:hypothetical protein Tco_0184880 [Tanacetum coccineum]
MDSEYSRSMTGVKSYMHKYVEQPGPKVVFGDNSSCITEGYFHAFGYPVFIHNHKEHLGKFDVKVDDGYFLGYSFISKALRVFNRRRQQIKETYHVTFNESIEAIRFTNTFLDEIGIDDSSRYPSDEFLHEGPPDQVNTKESQRQAVQDEPINNQPTEEPPGINTETYTYEPTKSMLTKSMAVKLTAALASECLFADFLYEIGKMQVCDKKHGKWTDMYGYCKYHKKRAKTGQKRTRERKEYTRDGKDQQWSTKINKSQQSKNVIKCYHWPELTQGLPRGYQTNTPKREIYTENNAKETQRLQRVGIATLAIRVLLSHPRATNQRPMIRRIEWSRSKGASNA